MISPTVSVNHYHLAFWIIILILPAVIVAPTSKTNRMKLRTLLAFFILSSSLSLSAQESSENVSDEPTTTEEATEKEAKEKKPRPPFYDNKLPYIYVGGGNLSLLADDIASDINLYNTTNWKWGINAGVEHRTFSAVGFSLNFLYGWLGQTERSPIAENNRNIETEMMSLDFKVHAYLDNNLFINRASRFSPYVFGGVGYILSMRHRADQLSEDGREYFYWDDGTVRDRPKTPENLGTAEVLAVDNDYETELEESYNGTALPTGAITFPFGLGLRYKFGRKFHADISATYYWSLSDQLDAFEKGKQTDHFLYTSIGFAYHIAAKKQQPDSSQFDNFDFLAMEQGDDDGDGVVNINDLCANTPSGPVDESGCPLDTDGDGIPDFRDEESSPDSALVDARGVTIDPDFIVLPDTNAVARNIVYEAYPSMELPRVGTYYTFDTPQEEETSRDLGSFIVVDRNEDGFISAEEITWAIDAFFDGELDFSAAKLHDLIDFFFEQ